MNKIKVIILSGIILFFLSACKQDDIKSHKIETVSYPLISTNIKNDDYFTLIPITSVAGKTVSTTYIPYYQTISTLKVKYKYKGKTKVLYSDDFSVVKTKYKDHVTIAKSDVGKRNVTCVVYINKRS